MSDGMLRDILVLEKQIEAELAEEQSRADVWLLEQKRLIDRQSELAQGDAAAAAERIGVRKCQSARQEGAARLTIMRRHVRQLGRLSDPRLLEILRKYLPQLFSGSGHDHPDG